ncbi:MAG TPA: cobalamin-binding protein, partial [Zunongwangia profunda]|nr:cobalamin-binding protein [Zunongwangia profunda]
RLGIPAMLVDGAYFSWYGSRLKKAFDYFRSLN